MSVPLHQQSLSALLDGMAAGSVTSTALVRMYLDRIERWDAKLNSFVTVLADRALEQAAVADRRRADGDTIGALEGIPIGIKDSIPTANIRTTFNSRLLEHWVPTHDAEAVRRLRDAGAIILGKTNLNEFGWSLPNDGDLTPKVRNAWNADYAAIGSSSGSGTAVAAGFVAAAIGTDGGGSVRLPAGQNNLVGFKVTHGLISRQGMGDSWVSDIAPMTRTIADTALLLSVLVPDQLDRFSGIEADISGWKLGVPRRLIADSAMEDEAMDAFEASLERLRSLGADLVNVEPRGMTEARMANFIILNAQAHASHAPTLRSHGDKYGHSARLYHWAGAFLSAEDLLNARSVAKRVQACVDKVFGGIHAIVTPTSPVVTAEAARRSDTHRKGSNAVFTAPFNATGHPALSVPSGFSALTGLPIGLQIVGPRGGERDLLRIARALERKTCHILRTIEDKWPMKDCSRSP